jgi:hypothetical protein
MSALMRWRNLHPAVVLTVLVSGCRGYEVGESPQDFGCFEWGTCQVPGDVEQPYFCDRAGGGRCQSLFACDASGPVVDAAYTAYTEVYGTMWVNDAVCATGWDSETVGMYTLPSLNCRADDECPAGYVCAPIALLSAVSTGKRGEPTRGTNYTFCRSGCYPAVEYERPCTPGAITILEEPTTPTAGR